MRNYVRTCEGICSYNLVYNFLIELLQLQSPVFVVHFHMGTRHFQKVVLRMKLFLSLLSFTCHIVNIGM